MVVRLWDRPGSREAAAALLVGRIVTILGAGALLYLAYLVYYIPDIRFVPGFVDSRFDDPNFTLAAFILIPIAIILLASTMRAATCWAATILVICVAALEGSAYLYNHRAMILVPSAPGLVQEFHGSIEKGDCGRIGGGCLQPNAHARVIGKVGDRLLFDAYYNVDEVGIRRSLPENDKRSRPTFVGVFGDSNTFGMNVSDEMTLSGELGQLACVTPYNFAIRGGGTANMLAEFEVNLVSRAIKQKSGYFVYVYNEGHLIRNVGNDGTLLGSKNFPAYDLDSSGNVQYVGTLWTYRKFRNAFVLLGQRSNVIEALNIHPYNTETEYHRQLAARIIDRTAQLSRSQFPNSKFVILFTPRSSSGSEVVKLLREKDIRVLDYTKLPLEGRADAFMPDGHPSPEYHRLMAENIVRDLGIESQCQGTD